MPRFPRVCRFACFSVLVLSAVLARGQAYQVTDFYDFPSYYTTTTQPLQAADGNFYGLAAYVDGDGGYLYRVTPYGVATTIYTFPDTVRNNPNSLLLATNGNFYGTAIYDGANDSGSLFEITPDGVYTLLYSFSAGNGSSTGPAQLVQGKDGKLYGTTTQVNDGFGEFYSYDLTSSTFTQLYEFTYPSSQGAPLGPLVQGTDGNFYGAFAVSNTGGGIFKISPAGVYTPLFKVGSQYNFGTWSPLVEGPDGYFYGWVSEIYGDGLTAIYKINSSGEGSVVHEFPAQSVSPSDYDPTAALTVGSDGKIYGEYYTLIPDSSEGAAQLYFFSLTTGGEFKQLLAVPEAYRSIYSGLTQGSDGAFYATAAAGESLYRIGNAFGAAPILAAPVDISVTPSVVAPGDSATLKWSVLNAFGESANLCFGSGSWSGVQPSSGSQTISVAKGDYNYALTCGGVESSAATLIVGSNQAASTTSVLGTPARLTVGANLTLVGTVNSSSGSGPAPTGSVTFSESGLTILSYPLTSSAANVTFPTTNMAPGTFAITGTYSGDANYSPSTSATPATVHLNATPAVTVTATPNPVGQGYPLTMVVTVLPVNNGPTPTGTVTLTADFEGQAENIGTYTLKGGKVTVSSTVPSETPGNEYLAATYNGDANYLTAQGSANYYTVPDASVTLTISQNPVIEGQSVTLLAQVTPPPNSSYATGTVTFRIPGFVIGTVTLSNDVGVLTASSAGVSPGTYPVTATYNGDESDGPATSAPVKVTITAQ